MLAYTKLFMISLLGTAPLVAAHPSADTVSVRVRIGDLDVNSVHGQKILELRIDRAAREVCDFASGQLDRKVRKIEKKCREDAKARAWAMVKFKPRRGSR